MKILFAFTCIISLFITKPVIERQLSDPKFTGTTPRFTTDHRGNPVLSWVERVDEKTAKFFLAVSVDGGRTFGDKCQITAPATISSHAEGMPKLAFKADGTILAIFEVPRPAEASRFAGDLLFAVSKDGGKTWSDAKPIHRDTTPGKSHSFGNLNRLPNGEIGIVWLDDKLPGKPGRSVRFIQTLPGGGFSDEVIVDANACQCCRTNVFVDNQQQIHLTYRDMEETKGTEPGNRDISHAVSTDGGRTFSQPVVVYADNWAINACPHAGPDVEQVGKSVYLTWFSGKENAVGLRLAKLGSPKLIATHLSDRAKHPQLATINGQLAWVWDESFPKKGPAADGFPDYVQRICLHTVDGTSLTPIKYLTAEDQNATYPVVMATKNGLLLAYESQQATGSSVIVCRLVNNL